MPLLTIVDGKGEMTLDLGATILTLQTCEALPRLASLPIVDGIEELSTFPRSSSDCKLVNVPISVGSAPLMPVPLMWSIVRFPSAPISVGIVETVI